MTLWLVRDTYPKVAILLVRATYHSQYTNIDAFFFFDKKKLQKVSFVLKMATNLFWIGYHFEKFRNQVAIIKKN